MPKAKQVLQVMALEPGHYNGSIRHAKTAFNLTSADDFAPSWMSPLNFNPKAKRTVRTAAKATPKKAE